MGVAKGGLVVAKGGLLVAKWSLVVVWQWPMGAW